MRSKYHIDPLPLLVLSLNPEACLLKMFHFLWPLITLQGGYCVGVPRRVFRLVLLDGYLKTFLCLHQATRIYEVPVHITVCVDMKTSLILEK